MSQSEIVSVSVSLEGAATSRASFGVPLILDFENVLGTGSTVGGDVESAQYSSLAEMSDAGFRSWHPAYKMALAMWSQQPKPPLIQVASKESSRTVADTLDSLVTVNTDWHILLLTSRVDADILAASSWVESASSRCILVAETAVDGLAPGENLANQLFTAPRRRTSLWAARPSPCVVRLYIDAELESATPTQTTVTGKVNGTAWSAVTFSTDHDTTMGLLATELAGEAGVDTATAESSGALGAAKDYIELTGVSPLVELAVTEMVTNNAATKGSWRVERVREGSRPTDASVVGACVPYDPGTETWAYKELAGVQPLSIPTSWKAMLKANRVNWYERDLGKNLTKHGTVSADVASGTPLFLDLVRLQDAIESDVVLGLHEAVTTPPKLPYTDEGVAVLLGKLQTVEDKYVRRGALVRKAFDATYTVPTVDEQDAGDVSGRIYRGLKASWQTSGGIQFVYDVAVALQA